MYYIVYRFITCHYTAGVSLMIATLPSHGPWHNNLNANSKHEVERANEVVGDTLARMPTAKRTTGTSSCY